MPNTPVQAAGEAMPKTTRRTFLGTAVVAALPITSVATVANAQAEALSELSELIAKHQAAIAPDRAAWEAVSDLDDCSAMLSRPEARVQTSRLLVGRDSEGEQIFRPLYSETEDEIRKSFDQSDFWSPGRMYGGAGPMAATQGAAHQKRMEDKITELRSIHAERRRIEDECGYASACEKAYATMALVKKYEVEIIAFVPTTLKEAVDKANWCVWAAEDDYCYLYDHDNLSGALAQALAAIGRASI